MNDYFHLLYRDLPRTSEALEKQRVCSLVCTVSKRLDKFERETAIYSTVTQSCKNISPKCRCLTKTKISFNQTNLCKNVRFLLKKANQLEELTTFETGITFDPIMGRGRGFCCQVDLLMRKTNRLIDLIPDINPSSNFFL